MNKRPLSLTIIGWLFIVVGCVGIVYHAADFDLQNPLNVEPIAALFVRVCAIAGGIFILRGAGWSRWLMVVWLTYHVVLSTFHSYTEAVMHTIFLTIISFFLFRQKESKYFKKGTESVR